VNAPFSNAAKSPGFSSGFPRKAGLCLCGALAREIEIERQKPRAGGARATHSLADGNLNPHGQ
jgi:hypothetical protein